MPSLRFLNFNFSYLYILMSVILTTFLYPQNIEKKYIQGDQELGNILEEIRVRHKIPAIGAALINSNGIRKIACAGYRKRGVDIPVTINDEWHLASCTKAMTATLVGKLVENGALRWEWTLEKIFPEISDTMDVGFKKISIRNLLSHRSGLERDSKFLSLPEGSLQEKRLKLVEIHSALKLQSNPGTTYTYSNLGYTILGAVIERVTGDSYENQMNEKVFKKLGMHSWGWGGSGTIGQIDQPWPHLSTGEPSSTNGVYNDNLLIMAPAGCFHCTLQDWSLFAVDQLRGNKGSSGLLMPHTYMALQTSLGNSDSKDVGYAMGWMITSRPWAKGLCLHHTGTNKMNYSNIWIAPKIDLGFLVCVNQGEGFSVTNDAIGAMIAKYTSP